MADRKTETITIRVSPELKRAVEAASEAEKRSVSSIIELATLDRLYTYGHLVENIPKDRVHNVRGRWLQFMDTGHRWAGQPFPAVTFTSPNEPGFIFGATGLEVGLRMAEAAFDGIDYGRKNPKMVDAEMPKPGTFTV